MRSLILAASAAALVATAAQGATYKVGQLEVADTWSRPAALGMNGAGYMAITNRAKAADRLMSVDSTAARKVEIHQSMNMNGVMSMHRQDQGVPLPFGQTVTFGPGGYHVMFLGLTKGLKGGDKVLATLVFASGAKLKVSFDVRGGAATPPMGDMKH